MPASKAQQKAVAKYMKNNYDEIKVRIPKGRKADVEAYAAAHQESVNGLINSFLRNALGQSEEEWKRSDDTRGT